MASFSQRAMTSRALPVIYERIWRPLAFTAFSAGRGTGAEQRVIDEFLALKRSDKVLDVGCGPGNTTRRLLATLGPSGRIVGLDAAPLMLERAERDTDDVRASYVLGDATEMPFEDESFNAVTCLGALYLVDDAEAVLDELARVLKPGGRAVVLSSVHRGPTELRLLSVLPARVAGLRVFGLHEITSAFKRRGFDQIRRDVRGVIQIVGATKR